MEIDISRPVSEIMAKNLIVVGPYDPVSVVADIFEQHNIHHLPVTDEKGCLQGLVSKSDFLQISHGFTLFNLQKKEEYDRALYEALLVKDIMTKKVATLQPEDSLRKAAELFRKNLFHALPVVHEDDSLAGIITTYDLLVYAYR